MAKPSFAPPFDPPPDFVPVEDPPPEFAGRPMDVGGKPDNVPPVDLSLDPPFDTPPDIHLDDIC